MSNLKEKFYDLLQELVQCEVRELLEDSTLTNDKYYLLKTHLDRVEGRLGLLERRCAHLKRDLYNDGR
jgi:hypothetical protein